LAGGSDKGGHRGKHILSLAKDKKMQVQVLPICQKLGSNPDSPYMKFTTGTKIISLLLFGLMSIPISYYSAEVKVAGGLLFSAFWFLGYMSAGSMSKE